MNVPTGSPVERGRKITDVNPRDYIESLMEKDFSGYNTVTIHGETGLEEGIAVYKNGEIISSDYTYFRYNKNYEAEEGFERFLNSLKSRNGVIDTYKLSSHQLQLITTLNEEATLKEPVIQEELGIPNTFTMDYEEKLIKKKTKELTREQLLRKYGLAGLKSSDDTGGQLIEKARQENRTLKKFLEKER